MSSDFENILLKKGMIDSHFHFLSMIERTIPAKEILEYCFSQGLQYAVDIGINSDNFAARAENASHFRGLYTAHGYYPSECVSEHVPEKLAYLEKALSSDSKAIAVGEIGLDFFRMYGSREQQLDLFISQLKIAERLDLPVIIHSRDAEDDTLAVLSEHAPSRGGIIHCFSYGTDTAEKLSKMGFLISFAGNITYKKNELLRETVKKLDKDVMLAETDAPYLSPVPVRHKNNHPGYIGYTYTAISELKSIETEHLITAFKENFLRMFNLPE